MIIRLKRGTKAQIEEQSGNFQVGELVFATDTNELFIKGEQGLVLLCTRRGMISRGEGVWIAHGNNVITFSEPHRNNNYTFIASLAEIPEGQGIIQELTVFTYNQSPERGIVRIEGGYGFTSCGWEGYDISGTTERFDDVANIHTARADATARSELAGYSLNGYGFTSCGRENVSELGTTERFDDVANIHTARADATARTDLTGYSLNGYGFTSCGWADYVLLGTTERFDDVANIHTARADATARYGLAGYATNEYFVNYMTYKVLEGL